MKLILASLVYEFEFEMVDKSYEWDKQRVFSLYEKKPLMVQVRERASHSVCYDKPASGAVAGN